MIKHFARTGNQNNQKNSFLQRLGGPSAGQLLQKKDSRRVKQLGPGTKWSWSQLSAKETCHNLFIRKHDFDHSPPAWVILFNLTNNLCILLPFVKTKNSSRDRSDWGRVITDSTLLSHCSKVVNPELKSTHSDWMSLGSTLHFETGFSCLSISTFWC